MRHIKIMFVCLGNICRSPLAEAVFSHLVQQKEQVLKYTYHIDSSGTTAYHTGEKSNQRMRKTAERHDVEIVHRAKQFKPSDAENYDYILAMDKQNYSDIISRIDESLVSKIYLFRNFDPSATEEDVPDPYYGGAESFEKVFNIVERTCKNFLQTLENE